MNCSLLLSVDYREKLIKTLIWKISEFRINMYFLDIGDRIFWT